MTDQASELMRHAALVTPGPGSGYTMPEETRAFLEGYLRRYGFTLTDLVTYQALIDAARYCNNLDFQALVSQSAPEPPLRFLWQRLRRLGR